MKVVAGDYDAKERNAGAPQIVARGAPRSGDRAAAGMPNRAKVLLGCPQPAMGRIFLRKTLLLPMFILGSLKPRWVGLIHFPWPLVNTRR
jgi:hypothetical protein